MTDLERQFIDRLISAAWPLTWQVTFALATVVGYLLWSRLYFRVIDPLVRARLGAVLGVHLVWVLRHHRSYQTAFESGLARYPRWSWGIEHEHQRTWLHDGAVVLLCFLVVSLIGGLWPIAVFLVVTLSFNALSYSLFLPACIALIAIYAIFWSGRYEVTGML